MRAPPPASRPTTTTTRRTRQIVQLLILSSTLLALAVLNRWHKVRRSVGRPGHFRVVEDRAELDRAALPTPTVKTPATSIGVRLTSSPAGLDCTDANDTESKAASKAYLQDSAVEQRAATSATCREYLASVDAVALLNGGAATQAESDFPLAFAVSLHHQAGILEQFMASTFRPGDSVCVHVDAKADEGTWRAVRAVVGCYSSAFPSSTIVLFETRLAVYWGHVSVLHADLKCYRELKKKNSLWKYVFNPAGSSLPVIPASEMRKRLAALDDGLSVVDSFPVPPGNMYRFNLVHALKRYGPAEYELSVAALKGRHLGPPPFNVTLRKGSKDVALSRKDVDFLLTSPVSWEVLDFLSGAEIPDEHFYSTMVTVNVTKAAGSEVELSQDLNVQSLRGECVRFSKWYSLNCTGENVHSVCNFGLGDLSEVRASECMIANKFNIGVDASAVLCQAKYLKERVRDELEGGGDRANSPAAEARKVPSPEPAAAKARTAVVPSGGEETEEREVHLPAKNK